MVVTPGMSMKKIYTAIFFLPFLLGGADKVQAEQGDGIFYEDNDADFEAEPEEALQDVHQPKKSLAATLFERTMKQSVALVPSDTAKLVRFLHVFNAALMQKMFISRRPGSEFHSLEKFCFKNIQAINFFLKQMQCEMIKC
ncbi:hypothetical protein AXF42_Ash001576 [Apostasia shenzhenica]|uniref:Uncharacterized protein n=1 Tax=Apostasia shenzhenica TaxID=1088818 RepID=A0A2I0AAQ5_9ASPA|nr:hypothetical protein AXF42_Ash001576 [Apostasia shenzhenica]